MSRYYRELHDRELLHQAEQFVLEVNRRRLMEVYVQPDLQDDVPRGLAAVSVEHGRLTLVLEDSFPPQAKN